MSNEDNDFNAELRALLAEDRKIEAIRLYREATGASLAEAKSAVEALQDSPEPLDAGADSDFEAEIVALLEGAKKIEAIKLYRAHMGVGLKEAKDAVEAIAAERHIPMPTGCLGVVLLLLVVALGVALA